MNAKIILIICGILLVIAIGLGIYAKMSQSTETYKAGVQNYFSFEPHQTFGCAHYLVPKEFTINTVRSGNRTMPK